MPKPAMCDCVWRVSHGAEPVGTAGTARLLLEQVASQSPGGPCRGEGTTETLDRRARATRTLAREEFTLECAERAGLWTSQAGLGARSRAKPSGSRALSATWVGSGLILKPQGQRSRRTRASSYTQVGCCGAGGDLRGLRGSVTLQKGLCKWQSLRIL